MAEGSEQQKATMVHALREEPGSYTRALEGGARVVYYVRPSAGGGFVAGWEYRASESSPEDEAEGSQKESFDSHADAVGYLDKNFDAPLERGRG